MSPSIKLQWSLFQLLFLLCSFEENSHIFLVLEKKCCSSKRILSVVRLCACVYVYAVVYAYTHFCMYL